MGSLQCPCMFICLPVYCVDRVLPLLVGVQSRDIERAVPVGRLRGHTVTEDVLLDWLRRHKYVEHTARWCAISQPLHHIQNYFAFVTGHHYGRQSNLRYNVDAALAPSGLGTFACMACPRVGELSVQNVHSPSCCVGLFALAPAMLCKEVVARRWTKEEEAQFHSALCCRCVCDHTHCRCRTSY